nr:unnamed protein product [Digitaria exilis]
MPTSTARFCPIAGDEATPATRSIGAFDGGGGGGWKEECLVGMVTSCPIGVLACLAPPCWAGGEFLSAVARGAHCLHPPPFLYWLVTRVNVG